MPKTSRPSRTDWHPADITAALRKRGLTWRDVAREAGYEHADSARQAARTPLPRAEAALARLLGVRPQDIWPSRYDAHGSPRSGQYAVIFSGGARRRNKIPLTAA